MNGKLHIVKGLVLNNHFGNTNKTIHWDNEEDGDGVSLKVLINDGVYPRSPKEKFDFLFKSMYKAFGYRTFDANEILEDSIFISQNYLVDKSELNIFLNAMKTQRLFGAIKNTSGRPYFKLTYEGLNYHIKAFEEGFNSRRCFVAMAFQPETLETREAIRLALVQTGFEGIFVDELHLDSSRTINDAIIANLRACKFCIADFSFHKNGVYFESGFALGQGKPVIYTCNEKHFKEAHFDIKPLQHIIYKNSTELTEMLRYKIEAWINA